MGGLATNTDAEGSEIAQSITENGQKIIHINSTLNDGFIDLGLTLQHEAHRDGIVGDEQSQQIETTIFFLCDLIFFHNFYCFTDF